MVTFPNAKINIGLQVLRKRPDNYHDIETVFYPLPVYDVLEIIEATEFKLHVSGIPISGSAENLCAKVFQVLQFDYGLPPVHIYLHKNIPIGAGLGGGSSDAAFLIKLISEYFNLNLSLKRMEDYARRIGADCAFFIANQPVLASGIGDQFSSITLDLSSYHIVVSKPPVHISTAEAFADVRLNESGRDLKTHINQPLCTWRESIVNDFEYSIFERYPLIRQIKEQLYQSGAVYASMSGSGSAVYGIFDEGVRLPILEQSNKDLYC